MTLYAKPDDVFLMFLGIPKMMVRLQETVLSAFTTSIRSYDFPGQESVVNTFARYDFNPVSFKVAKVSLVNLVSILADGFTDMFSQLVRDFFRPLLGSGNGQFFVGEIPLVVPLIKPFLVGKIVFVAIRTQAFTTSGPFFCREFSHPISFNNQETILST